MEAPEWLTVDPEETVMWVGGPRSLYAVSSVVTGVVWTVAVFGLAFVFVDIVPDLTNREYPFSASYFWTGAAALVGVSWAYVLYSAAGVFTTEYVLTDWNVYERTGLFSGTVSRAEVDKVQDTRTTRGVLGSLLGYGSVEVNPTGIGTSVTLRGLSDPETFRNELRACRHADREPGTQGQQTRESPAPDQRGPTPTASRQTRSGPSASATTGSPDTSTTATESRPASQAETADSAGATVEGPGDSEDSTTAAVSPDGSPLAKGSSAVPNMDDVSGESATPADSGSGHPDTSDGEPDPFDEAGSETTGGTEQVQSDPARQTDREKETTDERGNESDTDDSERGPSSSTDDVLPPEQGEDDATGAVDRVE